MDDVLKEGIAGGTAATAGTAAVCCSGSVAGLSASGITSGLAALGCGFGMMTGIGVVGVIGVLAYKGTKALMDDGEE